MAPEQHQALTEIAQRERRSLPDLVRDILGRHVAERDREARLRREIQAIEELTKTRKRLQEEYGVWSVDLLAEARAERDSDIERVWKGEA